MTQNNNIIMLRGQEWQQITYPDKIQLKQYSPKHKMWITLTFPK